MSFSLLTPRRYQLNKDGVQVVRSGHPWLFRSHLSSAANVFADGQWLALYDGTNRIVGYGIFAKEGLIAVRLLKRGDIAPNAKWLEGKFEAAWTKRVAWAKEHRYEAFRILHGESDGVPGVVFDQYGEYGVLQTYNSSVDPIGRYAARWLQRRQNLKGVIWKFPTKRRRVEQRAERKCEVRDRTLRGQIPPAVSFQEGDLRLTVEMGEGQKSGAFLDLRGLRQWIASQKLEGKRVLNLFSYTGTLGLASEVAGAAEIWNVDISTGALEAGQRFHTQSPAKHRWVSADIFEWISQLSTEEKFDLIIVDPPMMASRTEQVPGALRAYKRIYRAALGALAPGGQIVACCCTSRIPRKSFDMEVARALGSSVRRRAVLPPELDHPVGFAEADYLKVNVYS